MGLGRALGVAAAAVAVAASGCGGERGPATVESTRPCLRELGYRIRPPAASDLITSTAANGGLRAVGFGNTLTIAFGADARDAVRLARAYRMFARNAAARELIQPRRNAVMVWTIAPTQGQFDAAVKCLG